MAGRFVLVRLVNMRGVDLTLFDFDYDLTWVGFFLNANGKVYGRYGGRDEGHADEGLSLAGLKYAMQGALQDYAADPNGSRTTVAKPQRTVEEFRAISRLKQGACVHCHQVYVFRREDMVLDGKWTRDDIWVYPPPERLGMTLDVAQGDRLAAVAVGSPAELAGLRAGDVLESIDGNSVHSYGDVQYALHRAPKTGELPVAFERDGRRQDATIPLATGWRESDITWRVSMWGLEPQAQVYGKDLTPAAKRELGLAPDRLAFAQGKFVPEGSRKAGVRAGDVILGIDGAEMKMTMLQFNVYVRLNHRVGDRIVFDVLRNGKRMEIPMTLHSRIPGSE